MKLKKLFRRKRKCNKKKFTGAEFMRQYRSMTRDMEPKTKCQNVVVKGIGNFALQKAEAIPGI